MPKTIDKLKLAEAVHLAVEQNRTLKIARLKVQENEHRKEGARSAYFPIHITDLENVLIPPGAFGTVVGVLSQGKETLYSSGTMLAQPLTQLLRIHQENRIAAAEIVTSRDDLKNAENEIALEVHTLYYGIPVAYSSRDHLMTRFLSVQFEPQWTAERRMNSGS